MNKDANKEQNDISDNFLKDPSINSVEEEEDGKRLYDREEEIQEQIYTDIKEDDQKLIDRQQQRDLELSQQQEKSEEIQNQPVDKGLTN